MYKKPERWHLDIILGNVTNDELLFDDEVLDTDDARLDPAAHRFYHKLDKVQ